MDPASFTSDHRYAGASWQQQQQEDLAQQKQHDEEQFKVLSAKHDSLHLGLEHQGKQAVHCLHHFAVDEMLICGTALQYLLTKQATRAATSWLPQHVCHIMSVETSTTSATHIVGRRKAKRLGNSRQHTACRIMAVEHQQQHIFVAAAMSASSPSW